MLQQFQFEVDLLCKAARLKAKTENIFQGFMTQKLKGGIRLVTEEIRDLLNVDTAVLMGANLAPEVANEDFCEATIGRYR